VPRASRFNAFGEPLKKTVSPPEFGCDKLIPFTFVGLENAIAGTPLGRNVTTLVGVIAARSVSLKIAAGKRARAACLGGINGCWRHIKNNPKNRQRRQQNVSKN
jgi:hypothetical protein